MNRSKMGAVLAGLRGGNTVGEGPLEVMTRLSAFNMVEVEAPGGGPPQTAGANSLVAFTAMTFREVMDDEGMPTDAWEFRVPSAAPGGARATALMFVSGADIFVIRAMSKVVG